MSTPADVLIRAPKPDENAWIERYLRESWGSTTVVSRGVAHDASRLPALVAVQGDQIVGLATFRCDGGDCELVTLDALCRRQGIGSALLAAVTDEAARRGWTVAGSASTTCTRCHGRP